MEYNFLLTLIYLQHTNVTLPLIAYTHYTHHLVKWKLDSWLGPVQRLARLVTDTLDKWALATYNGNRSKCNDGHFGGSGIPVAGLPLGL